MLLLLLACAPQLDGPPSWALNYASVEPTASGFQGLQVWNLYAEGWEKDQSDDYFQCRVIQEVSGQVVAPLEGCEGCVASYGVELLTSEEEDCPEGITDGLVLDGVVSFAVGTLAPQEQAETDYPDHTMAWYLSFDGTQAELHGHAWPQALEQGDDTAPSGWVAGEVYTLWPTFAWSL